MMKLFLINNFCLFFILNSYLILSEEISKSPKNIILNLENTITKSKTDQLSGIFKKSINKIKNRHKKIDVIFLIDSSSSVGKVNFRSEIRFVKKLLSDFNVSYNNTRVSVITFSSQGKIIRHIDQISTPNEDNDKCRLLNHEIPKIKFTGGGTYTYGALKKARDTLNKGRNDAKKIVFLITDGYSNGRSPVPMAQQLKNDQCLIFTIGIQTGNSAELYNISSTPGEQYSFLLDSFTQFESLARKALHSDYKLGNSLRVTDQSLCNILCHKSDKRNLLLGNSTIQSQCCDTNSECVCGTTSGHYSCMCNAGYYGGGLFDNCEACPNGTYWQSWNLCKPCPDINHVTVKSPSINVSDCICKSGFKTAENNRCEVITCPELSPPENGYFVKHPSGCENVLNAACGSRCLSGFQLSGSSIRLCQGNGTWSGAEAACILKTCPSLPIPYYGLAKCQNEDLTLSFDYSFRNKTFADAYENENLRITEPMPIDTDCTFKCGPGYYLVGSANRNCLPLSKWDGLQTACKQILCLPLPTIPFGSYDPTDCDTQKQAHSSNCTLVCNAGFEARGPFTKHCGGKRNGVWTHKLKTPKCVDIAPPKITCPKNYEVSLEENEIFALVKRVNLPISVMDNSNQNITFWTKPAIKENGIKLNLGTHQFTYIAIDSFKNKGNCTFSITVIDTTPPVLDNCIDPSEFFISLSSTAAKTFIEWEDPIIYDNSNLKINVQQSLQPGYLGIGVHKIEYIAVDSFNNTNNCVMNITISEIKCTKLPSPQYGQTICAQNQTHMWCEVNCKMGYGIYYDYEDDYIENLNLVCEHDSPKWKYEFLPDCSLVDLPESVEEVFTISLDSTDNNMCADTNITLKIQEQLKLQIHSQLCGTQGDKCEIVSEIDICENEDLNDVTVADEENLINVDKRSSNNNTFYNIVKREIRNEKKIKQNKTKSQMKINIYVKISKNLGYWNENATRGENIKFIKDELKNVNENEELKQELEKLNINLKDLKRKMVTKCKNGSVPKKQMCVQCPPGTFHNKQKNFCQPCPIATYNNLPGQIECFKCPVNFSTRKIYSKSFESCREYCRPGTIARIKVPKKQRPNQTTQKSLSPFCKKCDPGEYQPLYDQTQCEKCPEGYTSSRESKTLEDCIPKIIKSCKNNPSICGNHGICESDAVNPYFYSCTCEDGYIGSHCEKQMNLCLSLPCMNGATCITFNNTVQCLCDQYFKGEFCEIKIDLCEDIECENDGTCKEVFGDATCECEYGFSGERCEISTNYCKNSPCENGECINRPTGYYCKCEPGFIGRRCHLKPCDYQPCVGNSICNDLPHQPATRISYFCSCPKGLKGDLCNEIDIPCDKKPCRNNGICTPIAIRDLKNLYYNFNYDKKYEQFNCNCPPYFYGDTCEKFITPDFVLGFEKSGINDFVQIKGPSYGLNEISFCVWLQTNDTFNYGVILSYASEKSDNMFTFTDYNGFVLYVNGEHIITDITINDGLWHFICVSWTNENGMYEIYLDGKLQNAGFNLSTDAIIEANGSVMIGQEQDDLGSSFSETEAFVGNIAFLDIWNYTLTAQNVQEYYKTCEPYLGNLIPWTSFKTNLHGSIKILPSPFCIECPKNLKLDGGTIQYIDNRAIYHCNSGFTLEGLMIRHCLRTSEWEFPAPFCKHITCGAIIQLSNGIAKRTRTMRGEEIVFSCNDGFYLVGESTKTCMNNGLWSSPDPECESLVHCEPIVEIENGTVIYATENGPMKETLSIYPVGTLAEIQCLNNTFIDGENFLTCLDIGIWDYPLPVCKLAEETIIESSETFFKNFVIDREDATPTTTLRTVKPISTIFGGSLDYEVIIDQVNLMNYPIETDYFQNLREFYFYGCSSTNSKKISIFCNNVSQEFELIDLTNFHTPDIEELQNVDIKWLQLLEEGSKKMLINENEIRKNLSSENLLNFLIYDSKNNKKFPTSVENTFRLYFCFYIDSIILEQKIKTNLIENNYLEKIQLLLGYLILPLYEEYAMKKNIASAAKKCSMEIFFDDTENKFLLINLLQKGVHESKTVYLKNITKDLNLKSNVGDQLELECQNGWEIGEITRTVCLEGGEWSTTDITCTERGCAEPLKNANFVLNIIKDKYLIGDLISIKCKPGFNIHGNTKIECLPSGKWSPIYARCTKISCNKPKLPPGAIISSGRSYLYLDKLKIQCRNKKIIEIQCDEMGKWNPPSICT